MPPSMQHGERGAARMPDAPAGALWTVAGTLHARVTRWSATVGGDVLKKSRPVDAVRSGPRATGARPPTLGHTSTPRLRPAADKDGSSAERVSGRCGPEV